MIKKSLFALFTTLIAGGVLLVGSTDAMTYTVEGDVTKIAIPNDITETTIKWCDMCSEETIREFSGSSTRCENSNVGFPAIICTHYYGDAGFHNITFNGKSKFLDNFSLSDSNTTEISNFNNISQITNAFIENNDLTSFNANSIPRPRTIYLKYNNITNFSGTIPSESEKRYLNYNKLTTIPDNVRDKRNTYTIKLSDSIKFPDYGTDARIIDLRNNPINFIKIINCGSSSEDECSFDPGTQTYNFGRFAYSYNTNNSINYSWTITKGDELTDSGSGTDTTANSYQTLTPGEYTFKVCYTDDSGVKHCDSVNFTVPSYNLGIGLTGTTSIEDQNDNIYFEWDQVNSESYPYSHNFQYKITPENNPENIIYEGRKGRYDKTFTTGYDKNKLTSGSYTFTISLVNDSDEQIQADRTNIIAYTNCEKGWYGNWYCDLDEDYTGPIFASKTFSVKEAEEPRIEITEPDHDGQSLGDSITQFRWNSDTPEGNTFLNYEWTISGNNKIYTGIIDNPNNKEYSTSVLSNGTYTFNVVLNYTRDGITGQKSDERYISQGGVTFTVSKTLPSIQIDRPEDPEEGDITYFSWTPSITPGFECNNYEWFISENDVPIITGRNLCSNTGYQTGGLNNGTYKFNVKLNYTQTSNGETGYAVDSRYASYGGSMTFEVNKTNSIRITNPSNGSTVSSANVTFTWEKNLSDTFSGYEIILTGGNNNINTREIIKTESTTTRTVNDLRDGSYRFKVIMHYTDSSNNPQTREDDITFYIDASAGIHINITKPSSGSNFITGGAREIPIEFEWNGGGSPLISGYSYTIKKGSTTIEQGTRGKNESGIYTLGSKDLSGGTYTFTVTMLAKNGAQMIDESSTFTIVILSDLNILSPQDGDIFVGKQDVQFSRSGFAEFSHYKYSYTLEKTKKGTKTTITGRNNLSLNDTGFTQFLENGNYEFTVRMMDGSSEIKKKTHRFEVLDITGLVLTISDGSSSWNSDTNRIEIKTGTVLFNYGGKSEDFSGYYYSITGTNFKGETFIYTGKNFGELTGSLTLTGLLSGKYRFVVRMVDDSNSDILTEKLDFNVTIPSKLTITNPTNGSSVTSSSTTFSRVGESDILRTGYTNDKRHYEYELLQVIASGYEQKAASPKTNANSFSYTALQDGATYQLNVKLYSGSNTLLASDTSTFSISIPRPSGGGGGGGSSSKSHPTNDLAVNITNDEPTTDERVEVVVDVNDKYTGKVDFTKMQYYSFDEEKWIDIPVTSDHYVSDSSDDAKLGYVKFTSDDDGEKELSEFLKFSQPGNYRLYAEDKDGYREYVEFYIGKGSAPAKVDEEEYYIARSCKKYKIEYYDKLGVYSSPNLLRDEFFVSRDYFYRYIDSKNKQIDGCPTNYGWINTTYNDTSNSSQRYTAPNGKVYFISNENGTYSSSELNKELNGAKRFSSINELKYFIRDRNPFINMYAPVK